MTSIDAIKYNELKQNAIGIYKVIIEQQEKLHVIENEIKNMLPKGYWYTYDIDEKWKHPKKYSIREVECSEYNIFLRIKEVIKKKPWPDYIDNRWYPLESFLKLNIYKTEQEAIEAHKQRICPKCGGFMMLAETKWCFDCMEKRNRAQDEFNQTHRFYDPASKHEYYIEYTDELTREYGYNGKQFIIRRKDTGEIIHTNNLWVGFHSENSGNFPEIEFVEGTP